MDRTGARKKKACDPGKYICKENDGCLYKRASIVLHKYLLYIHPVLAEAAGISLRKEWIGSLRYFPI